MQEWRRQPLRIVASQYQGIAGAPCIFPRWCIADLLALRADQGARSLLQRYAAQVTEIAHPEAAADIDSVDDLAAAQTGATLRAPLASGPDEA
ncbi:MAG: hypothetical protein ACRETU_06735, partial [Steroidobacterales bacterium]